MARQVIEDYGNKRKRFSVFTAALRDIEPGEAIAVGISLLDVTHVLTAEKTSYGQVFVQIHDTDGSTILADEYDIAEETYDVPSAVTTAVADATERFLRLRTENYSQIDTETLPQQ